MKKIVEFKKKLAKDKVDSAVVQRNGKVIFEHYRNNKMREKQHKIYSVTKSILSALIGIAIEKGYIKNVDVPIIHYFPQFDKDKEDERITIKHLLTMTSGLHWPGNNAMIPSKNWVNFVLKQDIEDAPGKGMVYSCGTSHLLSAILQKSTDLSAEEFAKKHLFTPLEITDYKWNRDAQGISIGGFGITMRTEDMLKIGTLYLNKGQWKSKQLVPEWWVEESTLPKVKINDNYFYAYHWWNMDFPGQLGRVFYASGYEGQYIIVAPEEQLVVVLTGSMKNDEADPLGYVREFVLSHSVDL